MHHSHMNCCFEGPDGRFEGPDGRFDGPDCRFEGPDGDDRARDQVFHPAEHQPTLHIIR